MANNMVMDLANVTVANNNNVVAKEEKVMANNSVVAEVVLGFSAEKLETMKVEELKDAARLCGVKLSGKKADLIERLVPFCKKELEVKIISAPVVAWKDMTPAEKLEDAKLPKWNNISMILAAEFTMQSQYRKYANAAAGKDMGEIWRLFYKNTKGKVVKDDYLVKTKRLFAATSRVIEVFGKDKIKKEDITSDLIQQALNAMFVRGFINFKKVNGNKNDENITFSASKDQMNAMFKFAAPIYAANKDNDLLK